MVLESCCDIFLIPGFLHKSGNLGKNVYVYLRETMSVSGDLGLNVRRKENPSGKFDHLKDVATGCKQFECYVDLYDKNVFHFMEEYASVLHMNNFRASPEHIKFFEEVRPLLLEPIALAVYELRDGQLGDMLNPIGPKGEGGLDDATGQAGRGGEAYMKPKAKKKRGIEYESTTNGLARKASEERKEAEEDKWSFEKIIARVLGQDSKSTEEEQWSLKSLFGRKK